MVPHEPVIARLLLIAAAVCALIAALIFGLSIDKLGPGMAWIAGALCAWFLAQAVG